MVSVRVVKVVLTRVCMGVTLMEYLMSFVWYFFFSHTIIAASPDTPLIRWLLSAQSTKSLAHSDLEHGLVDFSKCQGIPPEAVLTLTSRWTRPDQSEVHVMCKRSQPWMLTRPEVDEAEAKSMRPRLRPTPTRPRPTLTRPRPKLH